MASLHIKMNGKNLKIYQDNLKKLSAEQIDSFSRQAMKDIAGKLEAKVTLLTPVSEPIIDDKAPKTKDANKETDETEEKKVKQTGGNLRRSWTTRNVVKTNHDYNITVINTAPYATYVEHGHRGVYIPKLGVTLHIDTKHTEGKHMLEISTAEIKKEAPVMLRKKLNQLLKRLENG